MIINYAIVYSVVYERKVKKIQQKFYFITWTNGELKMKKFFTLMRIYIFYSLS